MIRRGACVALVLVIAAALLGSALVEAQSRPSVTVTTYNVARYEIIRDNLLPVWQERYPHIEIKLELHTSTTDQLQKVMVTMGTDAAPDIIDTAGTLLFSYVANGGGVDIRPYLERDFDPSDWFPHTLEETRYPHEVGAGLFGLPYDWVGGVFVYNKDLFDQMGLPYPDESWTWDYLRIAARRLTQDTNGDGVPDVWGFSLPALSNVTFDPVVRAYGGELLSPDRRTSALNSPATVNVLELFYSMVVEDQSTAFRRGTIFNNGTAAMEVTGSWALRLTDAAEINYGLSVVPQGPAGRVAYGGSNVWAVIKRQGQDMEAVWTVLKELVSAETLRLTSNVYGLPSRRSMVPEWTPSPVNQVLMQSAPYMRDGGWTPDWSAWQNAKANALNPAVEGALPIPEALERAVTAVNAILATAYGN